jgi:hypothetical protein
VSTLLTFGLSSDPEQFVVPVQFCTVTVMPGLRAVVPPCSVATLCSV